MTTWITAMGRLFRCGLALAVVALVIAVAGIACGDSTSQSEPPPAPATPVTPLSSAVSAAPGGTTQTARGAAPATPSPSATQSAETPTPAPVPRPSGFLLGSEHGLALVQTTRGPSATREGWDDITLDLVLVKFGPDPKVASDIEVEAKTEIVCFVNVGSAPNDCLLVALGGAVRAELRWSQLDSEPHPSGGAAVSASVKFEVAGNATKATLFFAYHKVPLEL